MQQEIALTLGECLNGNIPFIASIAPLPRAPSGPLQNRPALRERAGRCGRTGEPIFGRGGRGGRREESAVGRDGALSPYGTASVANPTGIRLTVWMR